MSDLRTQLTWDNDKTCKSSFENVSPINVMAKSLLNEHKGVWSPVHMTVASAETCFFVTLLMILEKAHVEIRSYESEAEGILGTPDGKHSAITGITIRSKIGLKNESDRQRLHQLYQKAEEYCTVGNSFNFKIKIDAA